MLTEKGGQWERPQTAAGSKCRFVGRRDTLPRFHLTTVELKIEISPLGSRSQRPREPDQITRGNSHVQRGILQNSLHPRAVSGTSTLSSPPRGRDRCLSTEHGKSRWKYGSVVQREVLVHATWMNLKNMLHERKLHVNMVSHVVQAGLELTR